MEAMTDQNATAAAIDDALSDLYHAGKDRGIDEADVCDMNMVDSHTAEITATATAMAATRQAVLDYLTELQVDAPTGFNAELRAWVDDNSGAARALTAFAERLS